MATVEFWYDFASTYSYPAAMRIEALATSRGCDVVWRPFLLGPLFQTQGWRDSPFNIYPVKGAYMWRDLARICDRLDLPLVRPTVFPRSSLLAARVVLLLDAALRPAFTRGVFRAAFGEGLSIEESATLARILAEIGVSATILDRTQSPEVKAELRQHGERAAAIGLPGAPCLVTADGEIFWGNDRLEDGLDWALGWRIRG